jgi:predicted RNase H-like HicB family nuclease
LILNIEVEPEEDGRWIAEIIELPGVMAYGDGPEAVKSKVQALALRVVADRIENKEQNREQNRERGANLNKRSSP